MAAGAIPLSTQVVSITRSSQSHFEANVCGGCAAKVLIAVATILEKQQEGAPPPFLILSVNTILATNITCEAHDPDKVLNLMVGIPTSNQEETSP